MYPTIPCYLNYAFLTTVALAFWMILVLCHRAWKKEDKPISNTYWLAFWLLLWLLPAGILSYNGFYPERDSFPGKIHYFGLFPNFIAIAALLLFPTSRRFLLGLPLAWLTLFHLIRIPVELLLWQLSKCHVIPVQMTFAGHDFDILAGLTAPLIAWLCFFTSKCPRWLALVWNFLALGLLLVIIITANLSFASPIQVWGRTQPNIALVHFPFTWLATFVAPAVLLAHLIAIIQLCRPAPPPDPV